MTALPLDVGTTATTTDTSGLPTIIISVVLILVMIGVVAYLAWKNRKDNK